jgi:hypothetical protein
MSKLIRPVNRKRRGNSRFWKNALKGEPVFIIGNGPSAMDEDLSPIHNRVVIGINRAFRLFDPTVLMWQDASLFQTEKEHVLSMDAVPFCREIADPYCKFFHFRLVTKPSKFKVTGDTHIFHGSGATGPLAFQFAYALGCDPIVLIGFDCKYRGPQTDFYGVNRFHTENTLSNCHRGLNFIKNLDTDRTIINCSDNGVLGEREPLQDVVERFPSKLTNDQARIRLLNLASE